MAKRFKQALWEDPETKVRIKAREITEDGSREVIIDPKDTENWNAVIAEYPIEEITARTDEDVRKFRENRKIEEQQEQDKAERHFQEQLFMEKLAIMEIPEVKSSTNKKLRRRIRKANNYAELYVYGAAVVIDYDSNQT